jgi:ureidoglycolate dehydrogenase (NAD+)
MAPVDLITISHTELSDRCSAAFRRFGVPSRDARIVADSLVDANLRGVDSHGVMRLPKYISGLRNGSINPHPKIKIRRSARAVLQVEGDNGLGAVIASRAMEHLIKACKSVGVAVVGISGSNHFGMVSYYLLRASSSGLIGIGAAHGESLQVPFGGRQPFFGTNPIAFTFPAGKGLPPIVVDFATSATTFGKITQAKAKRERLPEGCTLDGEGLMTTDPHRATTILPAAGHKGYGLALAVEVLSGVLNAAPFGPHVPPVFRDNIDAPGQLGQFFIAIDPLRFAGGRSFYRQIENMRRELHSAQTVPGSKGVLVPGEPEAHAYAERVREGIPLPANLWEQIKQLGCSEKC